MIVSTCRRLWSLSACQKYTSSLTSFLRYYILKNTMIWLADTILPHISRLKFYQTWDWWWNINNNISFYFRSFPRKTNDNIFQKIQKILFWGYFGPFLPKFGQNWNFLEKRAQSVFKITIIYHRGKSQKETNQLFLRKMLNWRADRQQWFYWTLRRTGVQLLT